MTDENHGINWRQYSVNCHYNQGVNKAPIIVCTVDAFAAPYSVEVTTAIICLRLSLLRRNQLHIAVSAPTDAHKACS